MDTSSIPGLELMQIADVVAREKSIEREEVIMAMEEAIQKAGRSKYGNDRDIRAMIDRQTGSIQLERWTEVVDEVEDDSTQMSGAEGEKHGLSIGDFLRQPLPPIEFGRIAAQTAKQVISQKVREAERAPRRRAAGGAGVVRAALVVERRRRCRRRRPRLVIEGRRR